MKTLTDGKLLFAVIITPVANADKYREMFNALGVTLILDKATVDSDNPEHVFQTRDMKMSDLHLFDNNDGQESFIHYYEVQKGDYLMKFHGNDTSRREKHIAGITISYVGDIEGDKKKSHTIADIYAQREVMQVHPTDYAINWGGWGSVSIDTAKYFSEGIKLGVQLVEDCNKQFVK